MGRCFVFVGFYSFGVRLFGQLPERIIVPREAQIRYEQTLQASGVSIMEFLPDQNHKGSLYIEGSHTVKKIFTDSELTALVQHDPWKYNVLSDSEVRILPDGLLLIRGNMQPSKLVGFVKCHGNALHNIVGRSFLWFARNNSRAIPYEIRMNIQVTSGTLDTHVAMTRIGRWNASNEWLERNQEEIRKLLEDHMIRHVGISINKLSLSSGYLEYDGTLPNVIYITHE